MILYSHITILYDPITIWSYHNIFWSYHNIIWSCHNMFWSYYSIMQPSHNIWVIISSYAMELVSKTPLIVSWYYCLLTPPPLPPNSIGPGSRMTFYRPAPTTFLLSGPPQKTCLWPGRAPSVQHSISSEAARDKWLFPKKVKFLETKISPGSEAARDKWLLPKKVEFLGARVVVRLA